MGEARKSWNDTYWKLSLLLTVPKRKGHARPQRVGPRGAPGQSAHCGSEDTGHPWFLQKRMRRGRVSWRKTVSLRSFQQVLSHGDGPSLPGTCSPGDGGREWPRVWSPRSRCWGLGSAVVDPVPSGQAKPQRSKQQNIRIKDPVDTHRVTGPPARWLAAVTGGPATREEEGPALRLVAKLCQELAYLRCPVKSLCPSWPSRVLF